MAILGRAMRRNTLLLTAASVLMRCIALFYQMWLAGRIGAAGMGLFQLVLSAGTLFATLAVSGIRFATTRLVSEERGLCRSEHIRSVVRRCILYALFFGLASGASLWLCAEPIGFLWVRDARTVRSLRLFALGLPATALSAVFCGYFTAVGRVWKTAAEQLIEQLVRIALTGFFLRSCGEDIERCCAAVTLAGAICDQLGLLALALLYLRDRREDAGECGEVGSAFTSRLFAVALPLALSAWARSGLNTLRSLLVPRSLRLHGMSENAALALCGRIGGMAMPVLIFPTAILAALAELLVPALTEAQVASRGDEIRDAVKTVLRRAAMYSLAFALFFLVSAEPLALLVCRDAEAASYLRRLSGIVPFLYIDIVTDGCLKGLGQMMRSMAYNLAEAVLSLILVWLLLPHFGEAGYIAVLYACEIFNCILSLNRLRTVVFHASPNSSPQSSRTRKRSSSFSSPSVSRKLQSAPSKHPVSRVSSVTVSMHSGG